MVEPVCLHAIVNGNHEFLSSHYPFQSEAPPMQFLSFLVQRLLRNVKKSHVMALGPVHHIRTTRRNLRMQFPASCGSNIDITCGYDSHVVFTRMMHHILQE